MDINEQRGALREQLRIKLENEFGIKFTPIKFVKEFNKHDNVIGSFKSAYNRFKKH